MESEERQHLGVERLAAGDVRRIPVSTPMHWPQDADAWEPAGGVEPPRDFLIQGRVGVLDSGASRLGHDGCQHLDVFGRGRRDIGVLTGRPREKRRATCRSHRPDSTSSSRSAPALSTSLSRPVAASSTGTGAKVASRVTSRIAAHADASSSLRPAAATVMPRRGMVSRADSSMSSASDSSVRVVATVTTVMPRAA